MSIEILDIDPKDLEDSEESSKNVDPDVMDDEAGNDILSILLKAFKE